MPQRRSSTSSISIARRPFRAMAQELSTYRFETLRGTDGDAALDGQMQPLATFGAGLERRIDRRRASNARAPYAVEVHGDSERHAVIRQPTAKCQIGAGSRRMHRTLRASFDSELSRVDECTTARTRPEFCWRDAPLCDRRQTARRCREASPDWSERLRDQQGRRTIKSR